MFFHARQFATEIAGSTPIFAGVPTGIFRPNGPHVRVFG
jgi:hypothetical protein